MNEGYIMMGTSKLKYIRGTKSESHHLQLLLLHKDLGCRILPSTTEETNRRHGGREAPGWQTVDT